MNKFVLAALSFVAGAATGFAVGYYISIEDVEETSRVYANDIPKPNNIQNFPQVEKPVEVQETVDPAETERPQDDDPADPSKIISYGPARIAQPGVPGVNYSKVNKIIKENGYTTEEEIKSVLEDPENEETYEERIEREELEMTQQMEEYRKKNEGKIYPITREDWESDFRETDFEQKDLYYFTTDEVLTDENGKILNEAEYIGVKPRQFGWMANDEDRIYIRNFPKETEYVVWKEQCSSIDWWS